MLYLIITLFALAAVFGLIIAAAIYVKKPSTPKGVVAAHGIFAAVGLVLLIVYAINNPDNYPKISIIIFVIAALGGAVLFFNDMKKKPGPFSLVIVHALAAVTAFVLLLVYAFF
jgi:hypothetical protein